MSKYRTHKCNELRKEDLDKEISISGWINKKRDHGNILFIDLRDNYGITQCIIDKENKNFLELEKTQLETVIKIDGKVVKRSNETVNKDIETGDIVYAGTVFGTSSYSSNINTTTYSSNVSKQNSMQRLSRFTAEKIITEIEINGSDWLKKDAIKKQSN